MKYRPKPRQSIKYSTSRPSNYSRNMHFTTHKKVTTYSSNQKSKTKGKRTLKSALRKALYIFIGFGFFIAMISAIGVAIYLKNIESSLPDPDKLVERGTNFSTQIFDRNGKLLYTVYGDENREFVPLNEMPEHLKWALLSAEDIEFYQHKGLDITGIVRAGLQYLKIIPGSSGASTITQQLIRNTILKDALGQDAYERSIVRKIKEMLMTMQIEQTLTKDEILQLYMNEIFMGGVNYGFQSASKAYFGKDVRQLTLAESAVLAGIVQAPGAYNPMTGLYPDMATSRQQYVLDQMLKHEDLTGVTQEQIDEAKAQVLVFKSVPLDIKAPHFVFYVKEQLETMFGPDKVVHGGLKVTTTLDYSAQKIAEEEVKNVVNTYGKKWGVYNSAMVAIDPKTGDIISMVGSVDYNSKNKKIDGNVNVTIAKRQMGSSVKPFTYLTAFSQGYGPWLLTPDIKMSFGAYKVSNWDNKTSGLMVARQALLQSRNVPAVYTTQLVGVENFIKTSETLGIKTLTDPSRYGLSITLGAVENTLLEHVGAYTVFANEGVKRDYRAILEVKDANGETIYKADSNKGEKVWDEKDIYMVNWILCDIGGFGDQPMNKLYTYNSKRSFCGKTGTTDGPKDLTSIMYTKNLVVGFWSGNNDNTATPGAWSTTVPIYGSSNFLTRMAGKFKVESFIRPSGISAGSVCNDTGELATKDSSCKKVPTIYKTGSAPKNDERESVYVCKSTGLVSTNPEFSKQFDLGVTKYIIKKKLENTLQQSFYETYLKTSKDSVYLIERPGEGECSLPLNNGAPTVQIYQPSSNENVYVGSTISIIAYANASSGIKKVEILVDGTLIATDTSAPYSTSYNVTSALGVGTHSVTAIVYDNEDKTGSSTVNINVASGTAGLSISSPVNSSTVSSLPYTFSASGSGVTYSRVDFIISGPGDYSKTISDTTSADGWSSSFNDSGASNGSYTVIARGYKGSMIVTSSSVSFTLSK